MSVPIPKMSALLLAQDFDYLCASQKSARQRKRRPLRLPPKSWDKIEKLAAQLQSAFPNRYITINSTIEFILDQGLKAILTEETKLRSRPVPMDNEDDVKPHDGE